MKNKVNIIFSLLLISSVLLAQHVVETTISLNWNSVQTWKSPTSSKKVLSFEDAKYPNENFLPYFVKKIQSEQGFNYEATIENAVYKIISNPDELEILAGVDLKNNIAVDKTVQTENRNNYLNFNILPFIKKDKEFLKLVSFNFKINKTPSAQKSQAATKHTFTNTSVLAQGKFIKLKIANSGIYKLTYEDLNSLGINPANVRIYGYGGALLNQSFLAAKIDDLPEVSIYMNKGSDGIFNAGDYILFYAQGIIRWSYDASKGMFTHTINSYSEHGYYYVSSDGGTGKKIEPKATKIIANASVYPIEEFTDFNVH